MRRSDPARPDVLVARGPKLPERQFGAIELQKVDGKVRVLSAPDLALISLSLLAMPHSADHQFKVWTDKISIADQVVYQVIGWDPLTASLEVARVKDHR